MQEFNAGEYCSILNDLPITYGILWPRLPLLPSGKDPCVWLDIFAINQNPGQEQVC